MVKDINTLNTAEIVDGLNDGSIKPLKRKYYTGCNMAGNFIFIKNRKYNYFCTGGGSTRMDWKGYNWELVYLVNKDGTKVIGSEARIFGTTDINVDINNASKSLIDRAHKHLLFLTNHFSHQYIQVISDYQLSLPLFIFK